MKLSEIIEKIDKSKENSLDVDVQDFNRYLNLDLPYLFKEDIEHLKAYFIIKWYCTDSWVGIWVYFLNDKSVAIGSQFGRKSDVEIHFINNESTLELRKYLLSFVEDEFSIEKTRLVDIDEEWGNSYTIDYSSQLLTDTGFYKDQPVTVVKKYRDYKDIDKWSTVDVKLPNDEIVNISMDEFAIPFSIKETV